MAGMIIRTNMAKDNTEKIKPKKRTLTFCIEYDEHPDSAADQAGRIMLAISYAMRTYNGTTGDSATQRPSGYYSKANITGMWLEPLEEDELIDDITDNQE